MSSSILINVQDTYHVLQEVPLGLTSQPDGLVFHRSCTTLFQTLIVWTEGTPPTDLTLFSFALFLKSILFHIHVSRRWVTVSDYQYTLFHTISMQAGLNTNCYTHKNKPYVVQPIVESFNCVQRSNLASEQTRDIISLFLKPDIFIL